MNALTHNFVIETDIPVPPRRRHRLPGREKSSPIRFAVEALRDAPDGSSILIPSAVFSSMAGRPIWRVSSVASLYGAGWYACRTVDGGVRIWRVGKPPLDVARKFGTAAA